MIHPCPHAESHYLMASCPCGYRHRQGVPLSWFTAADLLDREPLLPVEPSPPARPSSLQGMPLPQRTPATDQGPPAADSGALTSDRRQGAARTVSPVVDHHSERTAPALPSEVDETVTEWVTCPTCKGEQTIHSRPFDIDITCPECDGDGGWQA